MSDTPNQQILEFLDSLPPHTQEIAATLCGLIADTEKFGGPDVDVVKEARSLIDPEPAEHPKFEQMSAAIFWCGLFDYHFSKAIRPPSSEEMHEILDGMEAKVGVRQSMRDHADNMDKYNKQYESAATDWQKLRAGPLSSQAISKWNHFRDI